MPTLACTCSLHENASVSPLILGPTSLDLSPYVLCKLGKRYLQTSCLRSSCIKPSGKSRTPDLRLGNLDLSFLEKVFNLQLVHFCLQLSFSPYSPLNCHLDALLIVSKKALIVSKTGSTASKKAPTVSKKAPKRHCKHRKSIVSRKLPTVRKKAASLISLRK